MNNRIITITSTAALCAATLAVNAGAAAAATSTKVHTLTASEVLTAAPAVTAQAAQADAGFLAYAPPPPAGAGALCLVDTGVNPNPDTSPGLLASYVVGSGQGATAQDIDPQGHGTIDAMIAGAAGNGMIGAWPQLKIVSVQATSTPTPGQEPSFEFDNYWQAMDLCWGFQSKYDIKAVDLPLSSQIPPTSDQAQQFANYVGNLNEENVAVVAAAGNQAGEEEEPAVEPNVFAVGADTAQPGTLSGGPAGSVCNFSATGGITFYAPGCGVDQATPFGDQASCCGDGTSQASAFTSAVIVAMMSYDPTLTYLKAEQLLVQTATNNDLNVAAAFDADGLSNIVAAGNAAIPQPAPTPTPAPAKTAPAWPITTHSIAWKKGRLTITLNVALSGIPKTVNTHISLTRSTAKKPRVEIKRYTKPRHHRGSKPVRWQIQIRTRKPSLVSLRVWHGRKAYSAKIQKTFKITVKHRHKHKR
jgi:hypothetical protein